MNFLATTNDVIEDEDEELFENGVEKNETKNDDDENCYNELSRVIGALECRIADRKKIPKPEVFEILIFYLCRMFLLRL